MYARELSILDIEDIKDCIFHHSTMYGQTINHDNLLQKMRDMLVHGKVYGCYDEGKCVGVSTQQFWKAMPFWIWSNVYVKNSQLNLKLTDYYASVISTLLDESIKYAETKEYFEFYYVLRDNLKTLRKKSSRKVFETTIPGVLEKYEFENIHFLTELKDIKWDYINQLIGDVGIKVLESNKNKVLVIRRGRLSRAARETK
jgi:hypothetical protein